jgi:hypothetical protein
MKKFKVYLSAESWASVTVEAENEEQAIEKALDETDGYAEAEFSDWSFEGHEAEEIKQTEGDDD